MLDDFTEGDFKNKLLEIRELEKKRIALELHDSVCQQLHSARMFFNVLEIADPSSEKYKYILAELGKILDDSIVLVRDLTKELLLNYDGENTLFDLIRIITDRYNQIGGVKIEIITHGEDLLSKCIECDGHILRLIQEFVHNSIKYSRGGDIKIVIDKNEERLKLKLSDNGVGFDLEQVKEGLGIMSIESRLSKLGAFYQFYSIPNIGTKLNATFYEKHL